MKESYVYPVIIREEDGMLEVTVPNFPGQMTDAENEEEAIKAAQELIALCIMDSEDRKAELPAPSKDLDVEEGERLVFIHVWMPYFRKEKKEIYVKKTLTIPNWLDILAKEQNLNFSAVLVKGLKKELGIDDE